VTAARGRGERESAVKGRVRRRTKVDREEKKRPGCEKGRTVNEGRSEL
jgi:hypothetical protein